MMRALPKPVWLEWLAQKGGLRRPKRLDTFSAEPRFLALWRIFERLCAQGDSNLKVADFHGFHFQLRRPCVKPHGRRHKKKWENKPINVREWETFAKDKVATKRQSSNRNENCLVASWLVAIFTAMRWLVALYSSASDSGTIVLT